MWLLSFGDFDIPVADGLSENCCSVSTHRIALNTHKVTVKAFSGEVCYRVKVCNAMHRVIILVFHGRSDNFPL